jgi:hypothetical protein|tara:strand:+ start:335 stop:610 length:276 start_codon:yes stop_codon:yes gene_type:complete
MSYNETEDEKKVSEAEIVMMRSAQRYSKMMLRNGEAEAELAIFIEYAWAECDQVKKHDMAILDHNSKLISSINHKLNEWGYFRWKKREIVI